MEDEKYKILEHPSDVKIQAFGKTKEELFLNAMLGMNAILKPKIVSNEPEVARKIKLASVDENALLVDFLSEVLYLIQTNKVIYNNVKFSKFSDHSNSSGQVELEGELSGNKVESFNEDIKGVTYHGLKIDQPRLASGEAGQNGLYEAVILFDI